MEKRLMDILPTRRDALKWGGLALAGTWIDRVVWPLKIEAQGKVNPRGTARNVIFIEMGGAISHSDCWDLKETRFTKKDFDIRKVSSDVAISKTLFPRMSEQMNRVALVRSMRAIGLLHFNGQYHTQTGRALNAALAKEIPAWGSVMAMELESRRRESDTFPTYISTGLSKARAGSIGAGFLPPRFSGVDFDTATVLQTFGGDSSGVNQLLEERWNLLTRYSELPDSDGRSLGSLGEEYNVYYQNAHRIIGDPRWAKCFKATDDEKKRYGDDEYGLGLILARNLIAADAGTRLVYVYDGDRWDQHVNIFEHSAPVSHYTNCVRWDKGFASLLEDLSAMPGKEPGKTLLDETIIVSTSEFGRTPQMNPSKGRDHYRFAYTTLWAGGGVKGGRAIGKTDEIGAYSIETGWKHAEQPWMDNTVATMYSALGIDWTKRIANTPSKRAYEYVQSAPVGGSEFISTDEIAELFV